MDVARPLCTPLGFFWKHRRWFWCGEHFGSVVWSLGIAWGKSPPKIHLDSGSLLQIPNPFKRKSPDLDHQENFSQSPCNQQNSRQTPSPGCAEGLAKSLCGLPCFPKAKKEPREQSSPDPKNIFIPTFSKKIKKAQFPSILSPAVS